MLPAHKFEIFYSGNGIFLKTMELSGQASISEEQIILRELLIKVPVNSRAFEFAEPVGIALFTDLLPGETGLELKSFLAS